MPVYLDVETRPNRASAQLAAREIQSVFNALGTDISKMLDRSVGGAFSKAGKQLDTSAARSEMVALQNSFRETATTEDMAANRMVAAIGRVEYAQARLNEVSDKYAAGSSQVIRATNDVTNASAAAAMAQRQHADAMADTEGAHGRLANATKASAGAAVMAGRAFNVLGVGSLAVVGVALDKTTKAAADFQQSQTKLVASAGESASGLKTVSDGLLNMAGQYGYTMGQLSEGSYDVEKAGYRAKDALTVLAAGAQGAKAEGAEFKPVLDGLTTSMHDFGFSADQANLVMSKAVAGAGLAKSSFQDFMSSLHSVEPIVGSAAEGLNQQQKQNLVGDVYGTLAQLTQSGTSPDQASQNLGHLWTSLQKPTQQMRDMMGAMGLDAQDLSDHLGERGLTQTLNIVNEAIQAHTKNGMVNLDVMNNNAQLARDEAAAFGALPGPVKNLAQASKDGAISQGDLYKAAKALGPEQFNLLHQWLTLNNRLSGFNSLVKNGTGTVLDYNQAVNILTGGQDNARTSVQLMGDNYDATNQKVQQINQTTAEHDGTVKGYNETLGNFNTKMSQLKGSLSAAGVELGNDFLPAMTTAVNVLKDGAGWLAQHKSLMDDLAIAVGGFATMWVGVKAIDIAGKILTPVVGALEKVGIKFVDVSGAAAVANSTIAAGGPAAATAATQIETAAAAEVTAEQGVTTAAGEADAALAGGGAAAGGRLAQTAAVGAAAVSAAGTVVVPTIAGNRIANDIEGQDRPWYYGPQHAIDLILHPSHWGERGHAHGGAIHGSGPKGIDSVLTWLAPGEHVLTHHDVAAMGGHPGVYAMRNALHRQFGGAIPGLAGGGAAGGYTQDQAAQAIIAASKARGLNSEQTLAALSVGLLETNLGSNPMTNVAQNQSGTVVQGLFQQDSGYNKYGNRTDPNSAAAGFVDQFIARGGMGMDPYQAAVKVQVGTYGADYVRSFRNRAAGYYDRLSGQTAPNYQAPMGTRNDPIYVSGSGGGTGSGGQPGYYTQDPAKMQAADNRLIKAQERLATAKEREAEVAGNPKAKQSERDRAHDEVLDAQRDLELAQQQQAEAQRGSFHAGRGGRGGMGAGMSGLPVELPNNFGLDKGLPGLATWAVAFLEDLALAPIENAVMAALNGGEPGTEGGFGGPGMPFSDIGGGSGGSGTDAGVAGPSGGYGGGDAGGSGTGQPSWFSSSWWSGGSQGNKPVPPSHAGATSTGIGSGSWFLTPRPGIEVPKPQPIVAPLAPSDPGPYGNGPLPSEWMNPRHTKPPGMPAWQWATDPNRLPGNETGPDAASTYHNGMLDARHFATGGPVGTDTIPAWLSPGEWVLTPDQAKLWGGAQYFDEGSGGPIAPQNPGTPPPPKPSPMNPQQPQGGLGGILPGPQGMLGPQPGQKSVSPAPPPGSTKQIGATGPTSNIHQLPGLATPGADTQQPGTGLPASPGIGIGGGIIGSAEGAIEQAGSMALNAVAPGAGQGASQAMGIIFQEINRAASFGAQAAGIGVEGILEAILPTSGAAGGDWMKTIPGRMLAGVAGVRPTGQNTAGNTQQIAPPSEAPGGNVGVQVQGDMHVHAQDVHDFQNQMNREANMSANTNGFGRGS